MRTKFQKMMMAAVMSVAFTLFAGARAESADSETLSINNPVPAQAKTTKDDKAAQEKKVEDAKASAPTESAGKSDAKFKRDPSLTHDKSKKFGPGITKLKGGDEKGMAMGVSPFKFIGALLLIGLLMGGFFFVMKKTHSKISGADGPGMTLKARLQIDSKNSVALLKVYEQEMLVGVGPNGLTLLSKLSTIDELDGEDREENVVKPGPVAKKDNGGFAETLKGIDSVDLKAVKEEL